MENASELKELIDTFISKPLEEARKDIGSLYKKVDAEMSTTQSKIETLSTKVEKTNGRVTELERDSIRRDTEMKMMKGIAFLFFVPVIVALSIWGLQNFISVALK